MDPTNQHGGITANHDVLVGGDILNAYPTLAPLLADPRQAVAFKRFDDEAKRGKKLYALFGVVSIALAVLSLCYQAFGLAWTANGHITTRWVNALAGAVGISSIVLIVSCRLFGVRDRWLRNAFARESLRLWRHQQMLDGPFLDLLVTDPVSFVAMLDRRWVAFEHDGMVADGALPAFVLGRPPASLSVDPIPPANEEVRRQVLDLQSWLRLRYQLRYATAKDSVGSANLSPRDLVTMTDWLATTSLLLAVALSGCAFFISLLSTSSGGLLNGLAALGIGLAILSAAVRALRAGLTIPFERDSYAEYGQRLLVLDEAFAAATGDCERWQVLSRVEILAAEELHRFVVMKSSSRFIF